MSDLRRELKAGPPAWIYAVAVEPRFPGILWRRNSRSARREETMDLTDRAGFSDGAVQARESIGTSCGSSAGS